MLLEIRRAEAMTVSQNQALQALPNIAAFSLPRIVAGHKSGYAPKTITVSGQKTYVFRQMIWHSLGCETDSAQKGMALQGLQAGKLMGTVGTFKTGRTGRLYLPDTVAGPVGACFMTECRGQEKSLYRHAKVSTEMHGAGVRGQHKVKTLQRLNKIGKICFPAKITDHALQIARKGTPEEMTDLFFLCCAEKKDRVNIVLHNLHPDDFSHKLGRNRST